MPRLNRDGVEIYYEVYGSGPVILLTHAFSATGEMWRSQVEAFSKKNTLVLWDLRGHGRSDSPGDPGAYSRELALGDMQALLDRVGGERAVVGGLSLGGYLSLAFYLAHPERVSALLIVDTGPGFRKDEAREEWNRQALRTADYYERRGEAALKRPSREFPTARHRSAKGLALAARGILTQKDASVIESLPRIGVPALIVVGANDTPFLAASDYMAAKIPGARKAVIPDAGHVVNSDQPEAFAGTVLNFLDDVSRQDRLQKRA